MSAKLEKMRGLIVKIGEDSGGSLPGLNFDSVSNLLAKNNPQLQDAIAQSSSNEDKDSILNRYKDTIRDYVNEQIVVIQTSVINIKDGIPKLIESVSSAIASALLPPAIAAPAAIPNPAYVMLEFKQKVTVLLSMCTVLIDKFLKMLQAALNIQFELPDEVLNLLSAIAEAKKAIGTIPV